MASLTTLEVAKSVNSLLSLSCEDQHSLLEVIEDYFTSPSSPDLEDSDSDFSDTEAEPGGLWKGGEREGMEGIGKEKG